MAGGEPPELSFEYTPTWVVAVVCFVIVFISVCAERGLHKLGKCLEQKRENSLFQALERVKEELMLLGFVSFLLTVFQSLIVKFCIPDHLANTMLPCKLEIMRHQAENERKLFGEGVSPKCSKGYVPFLSVEALHELHVFIFVLAVAYVIFCASTMVLGGLKIREWGHWEHSIRSDAPRHDHHLVHSHHIREFIERAGNYWRKKFHFVSWMAAFFKQFYGSVTKSDYIALRSGFIREHCPGNPEYDFHKYMRRTLEHDYKKIIGISWYLWLFVVVFLLLNITGWRTYFWLSFLPLAVLVIVGAKLEHIITELAKSIAERSEADVEGTHDIKPTDELFWFHRPALVLYTIHFILFQNSFELAFFLWVWITYGYKSCIMEGLGFLITRLILGVFVQVICSYSTLPLYALVSQMGSMFKETVFGESIHGRLRMWARDRKSFSGRGNAATPAPTSQEIVPVWFEPEPIEDDEGITVEISEIH